MPSMISKYLQFTLNNLFIIQILWLTKKVFIKSVAPDISECVIDVSHVIRGEYLIPDTDNTPASDWANERQVLMCYQERVSHTRHRTGHFSHSTQSRVQSSDISHSYSVVFWQRPDNTIFYDTILTDTNIFLLLRL